MAVQQITPRVKVKESGKAGKASGAKKGQQVGMIAGGLAGLMTGGPAGAIAGASAGGGLGGVIGEAVQPGQADTRQVEQSVASQVPTQKLAQGSQQLLDGIRSLENMPQAKSKYLQPLTQAYIQSQMELKRRS